MCVLLLIIPQSGELFKDDSTEEIVAVSVHPHRKRKFIRMAQVYSLDLKIMSE